MKKMKDSAMSAQTKDTVRTTRVLLLPLEEYQGQLIIADDIPFSTCILDLTERPGLSHIENQVLQITQYYNCSPHMPLWLKLIKINGFVSPNGVWYRGFSCWLFCPGYHIILEDRNNNRLRLAAGLDGQGKTFIDDFNEILGSTHYVKPTVIKDASKMLESVSKIAEKLAGDKPCIASIGYSLASKLTNRSLVQLLHMIDSEVQLAFRAIYRQVVQAQASSFQINTSIISTLCKGIQIIFNKIVRNQVADFILPAGLKNNSTRDILKDEDESPVTPKNKRKRKDDLPPPPLG